MKVKCCGCGKTKPEPEMKIYSVPDDKYSCNQLCKDKHDKIKRNRRGEVIWLEGSAISA